MSLRKFLLLPLLISLVIFVYFSQRVGESFRVLLDTIEITNGFVLALLFAALLQVAGHIVRAYKAQYLLSPVKKSTLRFQFRALSVGYLFNAILPLRLGELIRARIIAGAENISFGYALTLIIFERAIDAILLGLAGVVILVWVMDADYASLIPYVVLIMSFAAVVLVLITLLTRENHLLIRFGYIATSFLNENLKNLWRFKIWSVIYGLQQNMRARLLVRYCVLSVASWLFYVGSIITFVQFMLPNLTLSAKTVLVVSPYYGVAIPSGPANLGAFSEGALAVNKSVELAFNQELIFNLTSWVILVVPIALIGLVLLFVKTKETLWHKRPRQASTHSMQNKLSRSEDISSEMSNFLEIIFLEIRFLGLFIN